MGVGGKRMEVKGEGEARLGRRCGGVRGGWVNIRGEGRVGAGGGEGKNEEGG